MIFDQKSLILPGSGFSAMAHTNTTTHMTDGRCNLETESAQWANLVKMYREMAGKGKCSY